MSGWGLLVGLAEKRVLAAPSGLPDVANGLSLLGGMLIVGQWLDPWLGEGCVVKEGNAQASFFRTCDKCWYEDESLAATYVVVRGGDLFRW